MRKLIVLMLACFCTPYLFAAPGVTVSATAVTLLGTSQSISLTVTLIDPNNTGMLRVSGTGIVPVTVSSTVTPGTTATVGPIYGNDVIIDGFGNINGTYYKVQVFTVTGGIIASTPSLQNFYAFTGSGTIDLATATPLAPSFMTGTGGSVSMPGNLSVTGTSTFTGAVTLGALTSTGAINCTTFNGIECISPSNPQNWAGTDVGGWLNSAMAALPANGGTILMAAGTYNFSTQIVVPNKAIQLIGAGNEESASIAPTLLNWTGGATPALTAIAGGNAANSLFQGFALQNSGSGTVGLDLAGTGTADLDNVGINNVTVYGFSTAGVRAGNSAHLVVRLTINGNTVLRNNGINLLVLNAGNLAVSQAALYNPTTLDVQLGDATHTVFKASFYQVDIETGTVTNVTDVQVLNAQAVSFDHCFFESDGTGYTIDIPSTATPALNIGASHSRFKGAGAGSSTTYANHVQLSTATTYWTDNFMTGYASPSYLVKNDSAQLTYIADLVTDASTSAAFFNAANSDVAYDTLNFGTTASSGKRILGKLFVRAGLNETADIDVGGQIFLGTVIKNSAGTATMGLTLKTGSGGGNYTGTNTTYASVDTTNLCTVITVPSGWKLKVEASGVLESVTAAVAQSVALVDAGTTCAGGGVTALNGTERTITPPAIATFDQGWQTQFVFTGDGAAHSFSLAAKTSNAADAWGIQNTSATVAPSMIFTLMPSN